MATVCDVFSQLSICSVEAPEATFPGNNGKGPRKFIMGELVELGRDLSGEDVWQQLWNVKLVAESRLVSGRFPVRAPTAQAVDFWGANYWAALS